MSSFYGATVSKSLLGGLALSSATLHYPLRHMQHQLFVRYSSNVSLSYVLRLLRSTAAFINPQHVASSLFLVYQFRVLERRYGSTKFFNCLLALYLVSFGLEVGLGSLLLRLSSSSLGLRSPGPIGVLFGLLVPFYYDIAQPDSTRLLGIPISEKTMTYIFALMMVTQSRESAFAAGCGLLAGCLYRWNAIRIRHWCRLPAFLSNSVGSVLSRLLSSRQPTFDPNMGATLQVQREQYQDMLEQQQMRLMNQAFAPRAAHRANALPEPSEAHITRLIEMGFPRERVLLALRETGNDINLAMATLLQDTR